MHAPSGRILLLLPSSVWQVLVVWGEPT